MTKKGVCNVGLTIPREALSRLYYLYHASALLLPSLSLDFTDFIMISLHSMLHDLLGDVTLEPFDDTVFYSIRVPCSLKDSIMQKAISPLSSHIKGSEHISIQYGEKSPLTFNKLVRSKFVSLLNAHGAISLLSYVFFIKATTSILRDELSSEEINEIVAYGKFPVIPGFYYSLSGAVEILLYEFLGELDPEGFAKYKEKINEERWNSLTVDLSDALSSYHRNREDARKKIDPSYVSPAEKRYTQEWVSLTMYNLSFAVYSIPILAGLAAAESTKYGSSRFRYYDVSGNIVDLIRLAFNVKDPLLSTESLKGTLQSTIEVFRDSWLNISCSIESNSNKAE